MVTGDGSGSEPPGPHGEQSQDAPRSPGAPAGETRWEVIIAVTLLAIVLGVPRMILDASGRPTVGGETGVPSPTPLDDPAERHDPKDAGQPVRAPGNLGLAW